MAKLTHSVSLILCGLGALPRAEADSNAARDELSRAREKYYQAIQSGAASQSAQQDIKVRNQIMGNGSAEASKLHYESQKSALSDIPHPPEHLIKKGLIDEGTAPSSEAAQSGAKAVTPPPVPPPAPARPEVVLDGSDIPREVEFKKGEKSQTNGPSAVPGEGVDEVQFEVKKSPTTHLPKK